MPGVRNVPFRLTVVVTVPTFGVPEGIPVVTVGLSGSRPHRVEVTVCDVPGCRPVTRSWSVIVVGLSTRACDVTVEISGSHGTIVVSDATPNRALHPFW